MTDGASLYPDWQNISANALNQKPAHTAGDVHIWRVFLPDFATHYDQCHALLNAGEVERATRYHFEKDRLYFVLRRGLQRQLLSGYVRTPAEEIDYQIGPTGKLSLTGPEELQFNSSITGPWCVIALTQRCEIGIDIEQNQAQEALDILAQENFSTAENQSLYSLPEDLWLAGFYHLWTSKEAILKAAGTGLIDHLQTIEVSADPQAPARLLSLRSPEIPEGKWHLQAFAPFQEGTAIFAHQGPPLAAMFYDLKPR